MQKCKCRESHKKVELVKTLTSKNPKPEGLPQKERVLLVENFARLPTDYKKLLKDYPALLGHKKKVEKVEYKPWHAMSEMTKREFVAKHEYVPKNPKYTAEFSLPHPYYQYTANVYRTYSPVKERGFRTAGGMDKREERGISTPAK